MKVLLTIITAFLLTHISLGQRISKEDYKILRKKEDSLKASAYTIINGRTTEESLIADSQFTKLLVKALKVKNSFYYPFDSLITISKLVPPDSSFKIFTWQLQLGDDKTRQHGAIQMRTADGSLKLFPLIDKSDYVERIEDTVGNNLAWMGAVYYKIIQKSAFDKNFYTLLGYDENNMRTNRKIVEVLSFQNGEPIFGGPYFSFPNSGFSKAFTHRYVMEYKKHAGPRLHYDEDEDLIVIEHLISESGEPERKETLVPDGDYDALKWVNGKWVHITKLFTYKLQDGQAPVPSPIKDGDGQFNIKEMDKDLEEVQEEGTDSTSAPVKKKTKKKKE
jgi:hypothetical protein